MVIFLGWKVYVVYVFSLIVRFFLCGMLCFFFVFIFIRVFRIIGEVVLFFFLLFVSFWVVEVFNFVFLIKVCGRKGSRWVKLIDISVSFSIVEVKNFRVRRLGWSDLYVGLVCCALFGL